MKDQNTCYASLRLGIITLFIVLNPFQPFAQISVTPLINNNAVFRQTDIWNFMILNNYQDLVCSIQIKLLDFNDQDILFVNTHSLNLKKGSNTSFSFLSSQSEFIYGNNESGENLKQAGSLMAGDYHFCITVIPTDNFPPTKKCIDFTAKEFLVLRLVYPFDNGEVMTNQPILRWLSSASTQFTRYSLRLTVLNEGQSENEALEINPLYIDETGLTNNSLPYPFSAPALQPKTNYVWQVAAIRNQRIVAVTEPWVFHLVNTDTVTLCKSDCYRLIHKISNNEFYVNDGILRFGFENLSNDKFLNYKIINLENKKTYQGHNKIPLTYGLNKIDIILKNELKIKKNTRHLLRIIDSDNNVYNLTFNIVEDNW